MLGYAARGAAWVAIYLAFILAPLFALMLGSLPPARDFWTEFSAALGYAGLAMMGLTGARPQPPAPQSARTALSCAASGPTPGA